MQMDQRPTPEPSHPVRSLGDLIHGGHVGRADLEEIADKLWFDREGRDAYVRFSVLLLLSVVIATGGVLTNSTATVIGAMIVAPLMTPIMATALAVVAGDLEHLGRSLLLVAGGVAASIGLSYLLGLWSPTIVTVANNPQVSGRVSPNLADLLVALACGAAGGFALSRRNVSDALPGVAIAISLVPPLCVVGVMLANGDPHAAGGAMLLFLTNFLAILIAGGGLLAVMGYGRVALRELVRGRRAAVVVIALATVAIAIPLAITGRSIAQDTAAQYAVQQEATGALPPGYQLAGVDASGDLIEVTVEGPETDPTQIALAIADAVHVQYPASTVRVSLVASQVVEVPPAGS
ncbi:MAG TPA: DUF389 domain-containing protein [Actinomycetota bacterium]|nr:DUF389 domain-containing protein [Actinomycetota bacterium]